MYIFDLKDGALRRNLVMVTVVLMRNQSSSTVVLVASG